MYFADPKQAATLSEELSQVALVYLVGGIVYGIVSKDGGTHSSST